MAYNNYFPQGYQAYPNLTQSYTAPVPSASNAIQWVQGEAAARAYPIQPGAKVMLMDSETNVFYVKSSDSTGMPLPLRIFEYKEINSQPAESQTNYITKEEFEKRISELEQSLGKEKEKKNEQFII